MSTRRLALVASLAAVVLVRVLGLGALAGVAAALLALGAALGGRWAFRTRRRRPADGGFAYVFVDDDGSARELASDERAYLRTEFHPARRPAVRQGPVPVAHAGRPAARLPAARAAAAPRAHRPRAAGARPPRRPRALTDTRS